ncbi:gluconate 2-dehydrogenase subunit 3 family protein [Thalassotalea sp. PLHSN55]|uniref:gluconate 2-dehydrogenase subunit 3 family protein n=1 Tax=Thalassotalea sp. PLHSN55 TaxID=3435888 RepID=UPI003F86F765
MSFFQKNFQTPLWFKQKQAAMQSRRQFLKSAAGATAIATMSLPALSQDYADKMRDAKQTPEWQTLIAVQNHLLPSSASGPGAEEIQAFVYLYNIVHLQPTEQDEIEFIFNGVGWLNGYSQQQHSKNFIALTTDEKEQILRGISRSRAGENWLNTLLGYIFEAMLSPPAYGGNPNGIGWQWLEHKAGFPLPKAGQRYFEIPAGRSKGLASQTTARVTAENIIPVKHVSTQQKVKKA